MTISMGRLAGGMAAALAAATTVGIAFGARHWKRGSAAAVERLYANGRALEAPLVELAEGLPDPVERYFRFALAARQPVVQRAFIRWSGELAMSDGSAWQPFTAEQHFSVNPPGFVWDANVRVAGLLPIRVRDAYVDGTGASEASVGSVIPLKGQRGTREVAEASLMRYLAEAVWLPTALLPRPGFIVVRHRRRYRAGDAHRSRHPGGGRFPLWRRRRDRELRRRPSPRRGRRNRADALARILQELQTGPGHDDSDGGGGRMGAVRAADAGLARPSH